MICKNCGNDVMPIMSTGQIILGVILLIISFIISRVLYMEFCSKMICPVCKIHHLQIHKIENIK